MSMERKEISVRTDDKKQEDIKVCECFGWNLVKIESRRVTRLHSYFAIFERDTEMKHYKELVALEEEHTKCKSQIRTYNPIVDEPEDFLVLFLLFILAIFPLVIYCVYKSNQKKEIAHNNAKSIKRMHEIINEAKALL